ncbi:GNAT family N-acetyltransferase [Microbispora amethystogenes]|uniref:BioF2-like acetyltransferase domain-containing protein n=1 Tax=Microbispora amethystogenes TaxID=1427754 RepID=A0ABQ4FPQ9_9ACTN|nr:GNAT family N-acetyltransferase [Microbispora amethystogenes]GIH36708.1 hypothetical protein Mam01_68720 [Microbispora amethystogenes]
MHEGNSFSLSVETVGTLADLPPSAMKDLADSSAASFYGSPLWLLSVEDHDDFAARYSVARQGDAVRAVLPLYTATAPPHNDSYDPWATVTRWVRPEIGQRDLYPAMLAGSRSGYTNDGVVTGSPGDDEAVAALLADVCARLRAGEARSLTFAYLTPAGLASVLPALPDAPPLVPAEPDTVIDLPGDDFTDYLAALPSDRRRKIVREAAAFAKLGYEVEFGTLAGWADEFAPLLAAVQGRHGSSDSVERMRRYLLAQERAMGGSALALRCVRDGRLVGFSLFYEHGNELYGRVVGLDHSRLERDAGVYFTLAYYAPIRYAYARGPRRVRYGPGSYEAKLLRGARLEPRWSCTLLPEPPRQDDRARAARYAERWVADWNSRHAGFHQAADGRTTMWMNPPMPAQGAGQVAGQIAGRGV